MTSTVEIDTGKVEGRREKKQRLTRARLREAAYEIMSANGVDNARIKDITDLADIGFGTFYNYFESKDDVARSVLDCMIHDIGERIRGATIHLRAVDSALVLGVSNRLALRAAMSDPIWRWWARRPDLLYDRLSSGFGPYAIEDINLAIHSKQSSLSPEQVESAWALASWAMVGGIHDVVVGSQAPESETFVAQSILRILGTTHDAAVRATSTELPAYPSSSIDWTFIVQ